MAPRPALDRLKDRPDPTEWGTGELVSLAEAAALFFPRGPMTANTLRLAYARGELAGTEICGKLYTTPEAISGLTAARLKQAPAPVPVSAPDASKSLQGQRLPIALRQRLAAKRRRHLASPGRRKAET